MSSEVTIRVNFGKPMPLFPLNSCALMPHQVLPLNIFEPRYRQMVEESLDSAGQIGIATFRGMEWMKSYHGRPPLRPAVCVGQIMQHAKMPGGNFAIVVQGICRARIVEELPADQAKLYRLALLEPVGIDRVDEDALAGIRDYLTSALEVRELKALRNASTLLEHLRNDDIPTSAIIELLGLTFLNDAEIRYTLLETGDARERARIVVGQLDNLGDLLRKAEPQRANLGPSDSCPKGCSWN
jgi:uncharacterized protein